MENSEEKHSPTTKMIAAYPIAVQRAQKVSYYVTPLWLGLSVYLVIVGSLKLSACPVEPIIPIWAISYGSLLFINVFWSLFYYIGPQKTATKSFFENYGRLLRVLNAAIILASCALFIAGCVWVFMTKPSYDPTSSNYCDRLIYLGAQIAVISPFVMVGICIGLLLVIVLACCGVCCAVCCVGCFVVCKANCCRCCRGNSDSSPVRGQAAANTEVVEETVTMKENTM